MTYITVAFSTKNGSLLGWATRFFTRWRHSHVALVSDDGNTLIEASDIAGVREMPVSYLLSRDNVELRRIPHPFPMSVWLHAKTQIGKGYDEMYSWGWIFRRDWQNENQWACTELIEWACRKAGHALLPDVGYITPRDFYLISVDR